MSGFKTNIEKKTKTNKNYRKVLYTDKQMQLVIMTIDNDIPEETHQKTTQFIRVQAGTGVIHIGSKKYRVQEGDSIIIPAKSKHYVKRTGKKQLKLYTIYTPPEHPPGTLHKNQPGPDEEKHHHA